MSEAILTLDAQARSDVGKGASRRLRREQNLVPVVLYGANKSPFNLTVKHNEIIKALQYEVFFSSILTLNVNGKPEKVVLKDLQRHPSREIILHADFLRIDEKAEMTMYVPLHFVGEENAPGIKAGGIVNHAMNEIEVKCLPSALPEAINIDVSKAEIGAAYHITDIVLPKNVKLAHVIEDDAHDHLIFSIHEPKAAEEISSEAPQARETEILTAKADAEGKSA
jgi:large subunit ribosomal protein L25